MKTLQLTREQYRLLRNCTSVGENSSEELTFHLNGAIVDELELIRLFDNTIGEPPYYNEPVEIDLFGDTEGESLRGYIIGYDPWGKYHFSITSYSVSSTAGSLFKINSNIHVTSKLVFSTLSSEVRNNTVENVLVFNKN